jgi:hypothetical protein
MFEISRIPRKDPRIAAEMHNAERRLGTSGSGIASLHGFNGGFIALIEEGVIPSKVDAALLDDRLGTKFVEIIAQIEQECRGDKK